MNLHQPVAFHWKKFSITTLRLVHTSTTLAVLHCYCVEHMPDWCNKHPDGAGKCRYLMGKVRKKVYSAPHWGGEAEVITFLPFFKFHVINCFFPLYFGRSKKCVLQLLVPRFSQLC